MLECERLREKERMLMAERWRLNALRYDVKPLAVWHVI